MFLLNLSFSIEINRSFFFMAPGLLFKLLCLMIVAVASPKPVSPSRLAGISLAGISGKASASDSRFVTNFLDARLRFWDEGFAFDFSIREIKVERLIMRLSLFVEPKALAISRRVSEEGLVMLVVGLE